MEGSNRTECEVNFMLDKKILFEYDTAMVEKRAEVKANASARRHRLKAEINDLEKEVSELENSCSKSTEQAIFKEQELYEEQKLRGEYLHELRTLEEYQYKLVREGKDLDSSCTNKKSPLGKKDKGILEKCALKYKLYKKATGICWDYSTDKHTVQGLIVHKSKNIVRPFSFSDNVSQSLWKEIALVSDWSDIKDN